VIVSSINSSLKKIDDLLLFLANLTYSPKSIFAPSLFKFELLVESIVFWNQLSASSLTLPSKFKKDFKKFSYLNTRKASNFVDKTCDLKAKFLPLKISLIIEIANAGCENAIVIPGFCHIITLYFTQPPTPSKTHYVPLSVFSIRSLMEVSLSFTCFLNQFEPHLQMLAYIILKYSGL